MDWTNPPDNFSYVLFDLVNPEINQNRFYYIAYQPTLVDAGAVIILYGRKGESQRVLVAPFDSLEAAWPKIERAIRRRLSHGYRLVEPVHYRDPDQYHTSHTASYTTYEAKICSQHPI
jgi:predicted DNA-binding WGR domain protein